jgi:hypothetical protein
MPDVLIRIPKRFLDDHLERDLPTPKIIRETGSHYFIDPRDPVIAELADDATHYADGLDEAPPGVVLSARATLRAIRKAVHR